MPQPNRKLMAKLWESFSVAILPKGCGRIQRWEMRRAFYAGAQSILTEIMGILTDGTEPTEADLEIMHGIQEEFDDFVSDMLNGRA